MTTFWKVIAWSGIIVVYMAMAFAVYVKLSGNGSPWTIVAIMAPGVVAYRLGMWMLVRETKKRLG